MAGDSSNTPGGDGPAQRPAPRAKTFSCPNCGASVTIRYPGASLSAVCESCHSVVDVANENYRILSTYKKASEKYTPLIPIGTRGKLDGRLWEVIGFMVRRDGNYYWSEYLLFSPYYGYRFLVEADGHWNFVHMIKKKPHQSSSSAHTATLDGTTFRLFNRGTAEVIFVHGEFYWKVIVGSTVTARDFIAPPLMLSCEQSKDDIVWSVGTYTQSKVIEDAFKLGKLLSPIGVGPNQPGSASESWKGIKLQWLLFAVFLTVAQMYFAFTASNTLVSQQTFQFTPNTKASDISSQKFTLGKNLANVDIRINAPLGNDWLWVSGDLVNNADGSTFPFEQTLEYYFGTDSDGYWSEGSQSGNNLISTVPGGDYYLNFDLESGDFKDTFDRQFTVSVWRDVPHWSNYFWSLIFISMFPSFAWIKGRKEEVARWYHSDFSPYTAN